MNPDLRARAEKVLGYTFRNPDLLKEGLTHASIADNRLESNERMEFLGDAVLDLIMCEALYRRFPLYQEGDLTKVKSAVVSRQTCAEVAVETELSGLLIIGRGISGKHSMPSSLAAAVYESVVAAIYLDGGFEAAKEYVLRTMTPKVDEIVSAAHLNNYKALFQTHAQRLLGGTPYYEVLDEKGPEHSKCFEVGVTVGHRRFEPAWGPNKKMAEQKAALMALRELGVMAEAEVDEALEEVTGTVSNGDGDYDD
ncbi:MAG: ribonuclease [Phycisphaerales bacterium]|nr:ribonuclease [Phycisphaerales bacterium]